MLLNALQVLRYPAWLAAQVPAVRTAFTRALLGQVAQRLRMAANDPHWTVLALHDDERAALWAAPCAWTGFGWPRAFVPPAVLAPKPVAGAPLAEAAASLCCWRRALVRLLRRHAGLSLPQVVVRAAGVSVTPTHIDIVLPLREADAALRRVGLDGDLGWVAWFGWIVSFHYVEGAPDGAG
jgi:hypothetical protein